MQGTRDLLPEVRVKLGTAFAALSVFALLFGGSAFARAPQGDSEIQQAIIQQSVADYKATGTRVPAPIIQHGTVRPVAAGVPTAAPAEQRPCAIRKTSPRA
jgi:hypothetical protein